MPLVKGEATLAGHHHTGESGRQDVAGEGVLAVLEVVAAFAGAGDLIGVGIDQLGWAPERGGSDVPVRGQICPATKEPRAVVDIGIEHACQPAWLMEMYRRTQADEQITRQVGGSPLEGPNIPPPVGTSVSRIVYSLEGP